MTDQPGEPGTPPPGSGPAYPPPGAPPPGSPPPGPPPPGPSPWGPVGDAPAGGPQPGDVPPERWRPAAGPALWGAAHKPGAIPLKPLSLGELYDGAFKIIRYNPRATVGAAALVAGVTSLIPVAVTAVLTYTIGVTYDVTATNPVGDDATGALGAYLSLILGGVLQTLGLLLVTGMIAHVTAAAAIGRTLTLTEAWEATRGRRWRLIGLSLLLLLATSLVLVVLVVVVVVLFVATPLAAALLLTLLIGAATVAALCWFWVRVYLFPVPALMLEDVGVGGAVARGFGLTRGAFWRIFGIALLTVLVAQLASSILATPVQLLTFAGSALAGAEHAALVFVVGNAVGTVVSAAFVAPFSAAVTTLQYLDQRIRQEAFDVVLMERAGLTVS